MLGANLAIVSVLTLLNFVFQSAFNDRFWQMFLMTNKNTKKIKLLYIHQVLVSCELSSIMKNTLVNYIIFWLPHSWAIEKSNKPDSQLTPSQTVASHNISVASRWRESRPQGQQTAKPAPWRLRACLTSTTLKTRFFRPNWQLLRRSQSRSQGRSQTAQSATICIR